jgi:hypothetical protein
LLLLLLLLLVAVVLLVVHPMLMTKWAKMLLVGVEIDGGLADGRPSVEWIVVQRQGEDAGVDVGFTDGLVGGVQLGSYR